MGINKFIRDAMRSVPHLGYFGFVMTYLYVPEAGPPCLIWVKNERPCLIWATFGPDIQNSMANRPSTKIIPPKIRLAATAPSSKPLPSNEKVASNQKTNPDVLSRFLKNINYEYFRREFASVKEKIKDGNRKVILANPSSNIGFKRPPGMTKCAPQSVPCTTMAAAPPLPRGRAGGGGYKLFVLKSLIGMVTVYSSVKLGIWGTPEETQELVSRITTAVRDGEFKEKVNNLSTVMVDFVKDWSESAKNAITYSANYLKEKFGKEK